MYNKDEASLFNQKAKNGLCSHAYIIDGADGIGKLDFALSCARALLCQSADKPCDECISCRKALNGDHPDIHIIGREKAAAIKDVRDLIRLSTLKPNDGEKQIFIVANAGKLREDSQNALLKIFEEPPESVAMFLLTDSRASLLPTVLSRGQRIHLDGLRDSELRAMITEKLGKIDPRELNYAVSKANGNLGVALKLLSKENRSLRAKAENILSLTLSKNRYELMTALVTPKFKREQLHELLIELANTVNEAQKHKYSVPDSRLPESEECKSLALSASKRALARIGEAATVCMQSLENNANVTIAATKLSIDLLNAAAK